MDELLAAGIDAIERIAGFRHAVEVSVVDMRGHDVGFARADLMREAMIRLTDGRDVAPAPCRFRATWRWSSAT